MTDNDSDRKEDKTVFSPVRPHSSNRQPPADEDQGAVKKTQISPAAQSQSVPEPDRSSRHLPPADHLQDAPAKSSGSAFWKSFLVTLSLLLVIIAIGGTVLFFQILGWPVATTDTEIVAGGTLPDDFEVGPEVGPPSSAIIQLSGDPIIFKRSDVSKVEEIELASIDQALAASAPQFGLIFRLSDTMLHEDGSLMGSLPSGQSSFQMANFALAPPTSKKSIDKDDAYDDQSRQPAPAELDSETEIPTPGSEKSLEKRRAANTSNLNVTSATGMRLSKDLVFTARQGLSFRDTLTGKNVDPDDAAVIEERLKTRFEISEPSSAHQIAIRILRQSAKSKYHSLMQISLYEEERYIATFARSDEGEFVIGADPWLASDIFHKEESKPSAQQYRLLDGIYSAAIRNNVPSNVISEIIFLLSRTIDLKQSIRRDEKITVLFTLQPRNRKIDFGRVAYIGIETSDGEVSCYVVHRPKLNDFDCVDNDGKLNEREGMVAPVNGVLTSTFGMRTHPILKTVRLHKGIDWAAPSGTPVTAAFDGRVDYAGPAGGYGNFIRIIHLNLFDDDPDTPSEAMQARTTAQAEEILLSSLTPGKNKSHITKMKTKMKTRLASLLTSASPSIGEGLGIYSGFRSVEHQVRLYKASMNAEGKPSGMVAKPGGSLHNHGMAADLSWQGKSLENAPQEIQHWVHKNAPKFALKFPMNNPQRHPYEPWHIEMAETRGGKPTTATTYAHLSRFHEGIKAGSIVQARDIIGYVGTSGLSTGPHLHFELYLNNEPVDPLEFRAAGTVQLAGNERDAFDSLRSIVDTALNF